jgi:anti-sigma regulatory factor (Ser/Thr protein kinase)
VGRKEWLQGPSLVPKRRQLVKPGTTTTGRPTGQPFRHEALLYEGTAGFLDTVVPFIREGVEAGEAILVAVDPAKITLIRAELNGSSDHVRFADMLELGQNPARIIPVWRDFVAEQLPGGRAFRGVGEPIWPGRVGAQLAECHLHESLLNVAFEGGPAWQLACPYDVEALDPQVVDEARRTHPFVRQNGLPATSGAYPGAIAVGFDQPFDGPPEGVQALSFDTASLGAIRDFVSERGARAGLSPRRANELVMAVNEVATNSVRYGGGSGTLRMWREGPVLLSEVRDAGVISDPLVGRQTPAADQEGGRGLWLVNQFCDLVQVRSLIGGVTVRLHMAVPPGR